MLCYVCATERKSVRKSIDALNSIPFLINFFFRKPRSWDVGRSLLEAIARRFLDSLSLSLSLSLSCTEGPTRTAHRYKKIKGKGRRESRRRKRRSGLWKWRDEEKKCGGFNDDDENVVAAKMLASHKARVTLCEEETNARDQSAMGEGSLASWLFLWHDSGAADRPGDEMPHPMLRSSLLL